MIIEITNSGLYDLLKYIATNWSVSEKHIRPKALNLPSEDRRLFSLITATTTAGDYYIVNWDLYNKVTGAYDEYMRRKSVIISRE